MLDPAPEPVGDAGFRTAGTTGALLRRRAARGDRVQPAEPAARVEAWLSGKAGIDHHSHPVDGEGGLGDIGRQHDAPAAGWRRRERPVLLVGGERAGEGVEVHMVGDHAVQQRLGPADLTDAGEEHEHVTVVVAQCLAHRRHDRWFDPLVAAGPGRTPRAAAAPTAATTAAAPTAATAGLPGCSGEPPNVDVEHPAHALDDGSIEDPLQTLDVGGRRHRHEHEVGPDRRCDVERQREAEVGREVAFVHLVEDDCADTG